MKRAAICIFLCVVLILPAQDVGKILTFCPPRKPQYVPSPMPPLWKSMNWRIFVSMQSSALLLMDE